jgi:transposase InsO family protein
MGEYYNSKRFHQALGYKIPDEVYYRDGKIGSITKRC